MDLNDKKVVITGGGRRIGQALVRSFAAKGARIVIHCRHSEPEARALLEEIGGEAAGHGLYVCDLEDLKNLEKTAPAMLKDASVLINNASMFTRRKIDAETESEIREQMTVNFSAPVQLMRHFSHCARKPGVVINLLDQGICRPDEHSFSYGLSKKALADATRTAALQLAPEIRVNGLAPGPVLPPAELPQSGMEKTLRSVPLRRAVDLQDLCRGAVFLAENDSVTGTILFIDCGQSLCQTPEAISHP